MNLQLSYLNQLNDSTTKWKLNVRIIRFWRECKKVNPHLNGFNLLVLDDQVTLSQCISNFLNSVKQTNLLIITVLMCHQNKRMEVIVPENVAKAVEEQISLQKVQILYNFEVKEYKRDVTYKCINYDKYILLNEETKIQ